MTILSIETSTEVCSAALSIGGICVASYAEREHSNHAALLPKYIESLLTTAREKGCPVEAIALSEGPGSYTGLRIGTSTAKGLCYGLDVPLIPIPTTEVLCAAFAAQQKGKISDTALLCPMIDARRMEVYTALYDTNLTQKTEIEAKIIDGESWKDELEKNEIYFFGNGAMKCCEVIQNSNAHFIEGILPLAEYMGMLAEDTTRKRIEGTEIAYAEPRYVKEFVAAPSHVKGLK